jgi:hypothetical protein
MLWLIAAYGMGLCACNKGLPGIALPDNAFQFPTGIAIHQDGFALVASSNFDMTYESGSLRVIDLNQLAGRLEPNGYNVTEDGKYYSDLILDDLTVSIGNFAGRMTISSDNTLAAMTIRETNQLVLVDLNVDTTGASPVLNLDCFDSKPKDNGTFPFCSGDQHVVKLDKNELQFDPFDVVLVDQNAYVSCLRSNKVSIVNIPTLKVETTKDTDINGTDIDEVGFVDIAFSKKNNSIYLSSSGSKTTTTLTNNIFYFTPPDTTLVKDELYSLLVGTESRGLDFNEDGSELAVIVLNPNMLVFFDMLNNNAYLGSVALGQNPSLVRQHNNQFFVTYAQEDTVDIIDGRTKRLVQVKKDICKGPFDIGFFEREQWALFTCFEDQKVAVVDVNPSSERYLTVIAKVGQADK